MRLTKKRSIHYIRSLSGCLAVVDAGGCHDHVQCLVPRVSGQRWAQLAVVSQANNSAMRLHGSELAEAAVIVAAATTNSVTLRGMPQQRHNHDGKARSGDGGCLLTVGFPDAEAVAGGGLAGCDKVKTQGLCLVV